LIYILSYGFMDVTIRDANGVELKLAPGATAPISIPIPLSLQANAPATMPLWYFNPADGKWHEEGALTKRGNAYEGTVTHFSIWNSDVGYDRSWVKGRVVDCEGKPVEGARVTIKGISPRNCWDSGETSTPADGTFGPIPVDANAICEIWVSKGNAKTTPVQFTAMPYDQTKEWGDIELCVDSAVVTITLNWGLNPDDLDAHLTIPNTDGTRSHLYYPAAGEGIYAGAKLDTDDTGSYGPEVVTIRTLYNGVYRYCVHHYGGSETISSSGARVTMVIDRLGIYELSPPSGGTGENDAWRLWDITVQNGAVTGVRQINDIIHDVDDDDTAKFSP
jgi:uncharacterized protein YfaP (DUF2135 family)